MPPAAATECERTGWTLETTATDAPACAAARAARCPASPAPMISTSCEGTFSILWKRGFAGSAHPCGAHRVGQSPLEERPFRRVARELERAAVGIGRLIHAALAPEQLGP